MVGRIPHTPPPPFLIRRDGNRYLAAYITNGSDPIISTISVFTEDEEGEEEYEEECLNSGGGDGG